MTIKRNPWAFAALYMAISMATEIVLIIVFRLHVPADNHVIAPILLTGPPVLAGWIGGYRRRQELGIIVVLTAALTVGITVAANKLTGINTGIAEPIINRSVAGLLSAAITNQLIRRSVPTAAGREQAS